MEEIVQIDYTNIRQYLKNILPPYLFVDKAEVYVGKSAKGVKNFAYNEWFFRCHIPDDPVVPGVFQVEAISQTAALAIHTQDNLFNETIYLKKLVNVDFLNSVRPGDQMFIDTKIEDFRRGIIKIQGETYVIRDNVKVLTCRATIVLVAPGMVNNLLPK